MNIPSFFASLLSGRRLFQKKPQPARPARRRATPQLEVLENRLVMDCTFTVIDSFSDASPSDATVDSGGTSSDPAAGIFVNAARPSDTGVDTDLFVDPDTTPPGQLADTRTATLMSTAAGTGEVRVQTALDVLAFASGSTNSADLVLEYDLSEDPDGNTVILDDNEIVVTFASAEAGADPTFPLTLSINGVDVDTVDVGDFLTPTDFTFDASAFVGEEITSLKLTFSGGLATDFELAEITGCFLEAEPEIDLEKLVNGESNTELDCVEVEVGSTVTYTYLVTNTGNVPLSDITVTDDPTPDSGDPTPVLDGAFNVGDLNENNLLDADDPDTAENEAETWEFTATSIAVAGENDNTATATGTFEDETVQDIDEGCYIAEEEDDFEGLTPGFWKNNADKKGAVAWEDTGFSPEDTLEDVFDVPDSLGIDDKSLLEALQTGGGGVNALLRHAVAALLNSAHPEINFEFSTTEVITMVNTALVNPSMIEDLKDDLAEANERGGGINQKGEPI